MSNIDQYQQRIAYFQNSAEAKERISRSENDRIQLEIQLNKLMNSDEALAKAKAIKLKEYYEKLCENEAKSMKRNQFLLSEVHRVDTQFQQLEVKLDRLNNLKKECEVYIRSAYPVWTNENKIMPDEKIINNLNNDINMASLNRSNHKALSELMNSLQVPSMPAEKPPIAAHTFTQPSEKIIESAGIEALMSSFKLRSKNVTLDDDKVAPSLNEVGEYKGDSIIQSLINSLNENRRESPPEPPVNNNTNIRGGNNDNDGLRSIMSSAVNLNDQNRRNQGSPDQLQQTQLSRLLAGTNADNMNLLREYERELKRQDNTNMGELGTMGNTLNSSLNLLNQVQFADSFNTNARNTSNQAQTSNIVPTSPPISPQRQRQQAGPNDGHQSPLNASLSNTGSLSNTINQYPNSLRQELNVSALNYLLDFIESELSNTLHADKYYRHVEPHYKNKLEIIKCAREKSSLAIVDPTDVSMVILDQLPIVIRKYTTNRCLFTPDLMGLSVHDINENVVSDHLKDPDDRDLWNRLIKHWTFLRKIASMDSVTLAKIFAPSLVGLNQSGNQKAVNFLEKIINSVFINPNNLMDTFNDSKSLTETSINRELVMASTSKLKESSVYQEFINSNKSNEGNKLKLSSNYSLSKANDDDDDDENDDIDALVAPKSMMSTNSSAANLRPAANVNSSNILANTIQTGSILKSPRPITGGAGDFDFDFSQSSMSESQKKQNSLRQLNSLRSSKDKKLPVHLRDFDTSSNESDSSDIIDNKPNTAQKSLKSDADFDFYN